MQEPCYGGCGGDLPQKSPHYAGFSAFGAMRQQD